MKVLFSSVFVFASVAAFTGQPKSRRLAQATLHAGSATTFHANLANDEVEILSVQSITSDPKTREAAPAALEAINASVASSLVETVDQFAQRFLEAGGGNDPIGTRGEAYFFTQAVLIVAIILGGIPVVSDYLRLLAGPGLLVIGMAVLALTAIDMGDSLAPWPKPNGQGLVQDGLYGQVRHPMYFGLLSTIMGFAVISGSIDRVLLTLVLYVAIDRKSEYEEKELAKVYPEYPDYKANVVSKFVPKLWLEMWKKEEDGTIDE